jgi:protein-tyrosine phosphatase
VIDLHSHILHGLDDGALELAESVAMARAAVADGIRAIAATPHVREDYPTSADEMERGSSEHLRGRASRRRSRP